MRYDMFCNASFHASRCLVSEKASSCSPTAARVFPVSVRCWLSTPAARGSPSNPMSDREIEDKLRTIAAAWRPGHDVESLIKGVWELERRNDVASLLALTVPQS